MNSTNFTVSAIGHITTPFRQKFAIPRQSSLARAKGVITLTPEFTSDAVFKGLDGFSHLWLLFMFHETLPRGWKPAVKAPRLGGNDTLGVFASRSTHRPNGIGMSLVENCGWERHNGQLRLHVAGVDLLDATPIVDIKPYLHYADSRENASDPLASYMQIPNRDVTFCESTASVLKEAQSQYPDFESLTRNILSQDPRPAYRQHLDNDNKTYKVILYTYDVSWRVCHGNIKVTALHAVNT
ncbi:tRNA (N6-threonylcarbamoyladenosine(37)-N6)-methyltransferase TrmO [Alteromonas sp. H39]|uniref:tRNA (N6-threonylcarbamoyladenosine(37)-N6)-methyltransferase TrmO n=1 Tax=Alteromonas sp. H39 TaxID=3389876 RepID=UPI0039E1E856